MENIDFIWDTLMRTAWDIEAGAGDMETNIQATQAGILLLLEHPVEAIYDRIEASPLPTSAVVKWILYEANKIEIADRDKLRSLFLYWNSKQKAG